MNECLQVLLVRREAWRRVQPPKRNICPRSHHSFAPERWPGMCDSYVPIVDFIVECMWTRFFDLHSPNQSENKAIRSCRRPKTRSGSSCSRRGVGACLHSVQCCLQRGTFVGTEGVFVCLTLRCLSVCLWISSLAHWNFGSGRGSKPRREPWGTFFDTEVRATECCFITPHEIYCTHARGIT